MLAAKTLCAKHPWPLARLSRSVCSGPDPNSQPWTTPVSGKKTARVSLVMCGMICSHSLCVFQSTLIVVTPLFTENLAYSEYKHVQIDTTCVCVYIYMMHQELHVTLFIGYITAQLCIIIHYCSRCIVKPL